LPPLTSGNAECHPTPAAVDTEGRLHHPWQRPQRHDSLHRGLGQVRPALQEPVGGIERVEAGVARSVNVRVAEQVAPEGPLSAAERARRYRARRRGEATWMRISWRCSVTWLPRRGPAASSACTRWRLGAPLSRCWRQRPDRPLQVAPVHDPSDQVASLDALPASPRDRLQLFRGERTVEDAVAADPQA